MRKYKMSFILILSALFFLSACRVNLSEQVMEDMNAATQKNATLENAAYIQSMLTNWADGAFISQEDGTYNWTHTEYLGSETNFTQIAEIDGRQYQLVSFDEEAFEAEWQEIESGTHQLANQLAPLFENTLEEEYFEDVRLNDEDGKHYVITLSEAYSENQISETIQDLEVLISEYEETGADLLMIEALETQIERIEDMEFTDPEIEIVINEEGYLIKYVMRYNLVVPDTEPASISTEYEITEYNLEDVSDLLPEI